MFSLLRNNTIAATLCILFVAAFCSSPTTAMSDKATGISFADKLKGGSGGDLSLFGVGVRKKGPIKVYSVGMYGSSTVQESLSTYSKTADKKAALKALQTGVADSSSSKSFVLKMNFKVGAEKMASAIADSVSPRCHNAAASEVGELKELILTGVADKGACVKGTVLQFDVDDGVEVIIDGKTQGEVKSSGLAKAFCDVYLDDKCVAPPLRESILDHCCAP